MKNIINENIIYVGVNDHDLDLFEGQYEVPNGMAYNSYLIVDDKIALFDSVERKKCEDWFDNIDKALDGKAPDYLIIQHMEPDHSSSIGEFVAKYPGTVIVGNKKTFALMEQFFPEMTIDKKLVVENGEKLDLGQHELTFMFAPMVHWPEVMMTYEERDKVLFSADAFGKFGALDVEEDWACEARRYYTGIVGKYGAQVQNVLKKLETLEVEKICPLHGPALTDNIEYYIELYKTWSAYDVETEGVCICYTSVYGNTKKAVELLVEELKSAGVETIAVNDLARCDMAEAVEDAFRYDRLVLATTTYNSEIFPFMNHFIENLIERNYQKRKIGLIENGSWAPMAAKIMKKAFEASKDITFAETVVSIKSSMTEENRSQVKKLAEEIASVNSCGVEASDKCEEVPKAKGFSCNICGYEYEGETLPADFKCPLCGRGAEDFSAI